MFLWMVALELAVQSFLGLQVFAAMELYVLVLSTFVQIRTEQSFFGIAYENRTRPRWVGQHMFGNDGFVVVQVL